MRGREKKEREKHRKRVSKVRTVKGAVSQGAGCEVFREERGPVGDQLSKDIFPILGFPGKTMRKMCSFCPSGWIYVNFVCKF